MKKSNYSSIESIISTAKKGGMFILVDDEKRENEGDLVISTTDTNAKNINFMAKYGRGLICLALDSLQAKRLNLSLMSPVNQSRNKTAFTISIEARKGITTGISAKDRARTIKIASKKNVNKKDIVSPGHVFPIIAKDGGVLVRAGHTEASVDISKLARKNNSAVICEIMNEDGTMAKGQELFDFAYKHQLKIGKIEDLIAYRLKKEKLIRLKKQGVIDVKNQKYKIRIYENLLDGSEHFALIKGTIKKGITPRVRVISSNVVKNYLINQKLPNSFNKTLNYFKKFNNCVLVFIKDSNLKSVTQTLKDYKDKDLYKKSKEKSLKNYGIGAQIIKDLKIKNMTLITKSPKKFLHNADKIKTSHKYLIVCEGIIDAIALDCIAITSNEASQDQIDYINQFKGEVIVCPDRDKAGEKLIKQAQENGWSVSFPMWEDDIKDAADAIQRYGKLYTLKSITR